jgi:pyridoxine 5-phosphate synthase
MTRLSVNLNKVALLRNARALDIPSVLRAAVTALDAGAHGITVHPRPDQRHIRSDDVRELALLLKRYPQAEFNIEGNPFHGLLDLAGHYRPQQCTLVPDEAAQSTSDHGWDLARDGEKLRPVIAELKALGIRVSLFMDATPETMATARLLGADRVELYTEPYARAFTQGTAPNVLPQFAAAARAAQAAGLGVNAGHDLNQPNLPPFLSAVPNVLEVSIGHALIADALDNGLAQTVRDYLAAIARAGSVA